MKTKYILIVTGLFGVIFTAAVLYAIFFNDYSKSKPERIDKVTQTKTKEPPIEKKQSSKWTVKILSSSGPTKFSGSYFISNKSGSQSKTVDGTTPHIIELEDAKVVSCAFRKTEKSGNLTVEIYKYEKLEKSESTDAAYGLVTVTAK